MLPFTWDKLTTLGGNQIRSVERRRIQAAIEEPAENWAGARTIVVNGADSGVLRRSTLWQCVQAATLMNLSDGEVPSSEQIIMGLCYATSEQYYPAWRRK